MGINIKYSNNIHINKLYCDNLQAKEGSCLYGLLSNNITLKNSNMNNLIGFNKGGAILLDKIENSYFDSIYIKNSTSLYTGGIHIYQSKNIQINNSEIFTTESKTTGGGISIKES